MKTVVVMQPYFYPYLGYFQMVLASDAFVFYDDVNFIKGGWINRNRISINGKPSYIGLQLEGASSNKLIKDISVSSNPNSKRKLIKTIQQNYSKAKYYKDVKELLSNTIGKNSDSLSQVAASSVMTVSDYLGIKTKFSFSSQISLKKEVANRTERLIEIIKSQDGQRYINAERGKHLYDKKDFKRENIELQFINPILKPYLQNSHNFMPGLSIIDVLMHNSIDEINKMLSHYELT